MSETKAIYAGSFDPLTNGHLDVLRSALALADTVYVAIGIHPGKKGLFSFEERLAMVQESTRQWSGVTAEPFDGLVSQFVASRGGRAMVRGLRAVTDFDYEFQLAGMNRNLAPDVETVFLTPSGRYQFVSSTFVREIALLGGDVSKFVSPHVWQRLMTKKEAGTKP